MKHDAVSGMTLIEVVVALGLLALAASLWSASVAVHANLTQEAQALQLDVERLRGTVEP